jgi:flavin-dependent dehydrogenase
LTRTTDVDVVVVGGGPVGLASAIEARMAGLTVAVIEARDGTIDKACGEGLMPGAVPLLERLGVRPPGIPVRGVTYTDGRRSVTHRFATGSGLGVRRTALHDALAARADELGVERVKAKVHEFAQDAAGVDVAGLRGSWLLAADGLHSTVRRAAGLERPVRGPRRFGLRRHYAIAPWSEFIEVHWARRAEVYVTPVAENLVGLAILGPPKTDFDTTIAAIPDLAARVGSAELASELRGAGPFRQRASSPVSGRVLLVGDASGYVDAITGEGLRLGFDQARAAVACIVADRPTDYAREWRTVTRDFRVLTSGLVRAASSPLRRGIVPTARALPALYGAIVERLAR